MHSAMACLLITSAADPSILSPGNRGGRVNAPSGLIQGRCVPATLYGLGPMTRERSPVRRRWRDYESPAGNRPVREFISNVPAGGHKGQGPVGTRGLRQEDAEDARSVASARGAPAFRLAQTGREDQVISL